MEEYRNGVWIGQVFRDMLVQVVVCNGNQNPVIDSMLVTGGTLSGNTVHAIPGQEVCIDFFTSDPDSSSNLSLHWNQGISGAVFSNLQDTSIRDTVPGNSARFCWTPQLPGTHYFWVEVNDGYCPYVGKTDRVIKIEVPFICNLDLLPDFLPIDRCEPDPLTLEVVPIYDTYQWSTGDTSSTVLIDQPGTYWVEVNGPGPCTHSDTVIVQDSVYRLVEGKATDHQGNGLSGQPIVLVGDRTF